MTTTETEQALVATNNYVIIKPSDEHETFGDGKILTTRHVSAGQSS